MEPRKNRSAAPGLRGLFLAATLALLLSCEQIETDPVFAAEPLIELVGTSGDTLVEFQDQLMLKIAYQDGDGDLGNPNPDINSIFVKDSRLENADEYYLGPLAPVGAEIAIQGTLDLNLSRTFVFGNGSFETTVFTIHLFDRAGNRSNTIETGEITILRE